MIISEVINKLKEFGTDYRILLRFDIYRNLDRYAEFGPFYLSDINFEISSNMVSFDICDGIFIMRSNTISIQTFSKLQEMNCRF